MAKLIFKNVAEIPVHPGSLIGGGSTDQDLTYIHRGFEHLYSMFDITQDEYDGLFINTKTTTIVDGIPSVIDEPGGEVDMLPDETVYETHLTRYKKRLEEKMEKKPNHSKISMAQDTLNFLNTIDISSLTFPTKSPTEVLRENNKYIDLGFF